MRRTALLSTLLVMCAAVPSVRPAAAADPSDSCTTGTLLAGYAGPASLVLRVEQPDPGTTWVCVAFDDGSGLHAGGLLQVTGAATASFQPDPPGTDQPPVPGAPPVPSGTCQAAPGAVRILDMQLPGGERAWIYLAPTAQGLDDLCAGIGGPLLATGALVSPGTPVVATDGGNQASAWLPDAT